MQLLVSTDWVIERLHDPRVIPVFVRTVPGQPGVAAAEFAAAHLPGARFLDLDIDLADVSAANSGRHPLPSPEKFTSTLSREGISPGDSVIAYDHSDGSQAARLWWMLRWIGFSRVAVMDGGLAKWTREGRSIERGAAQTLTPIGALINPRPDPSLLATMTEVEQFADAKLILADARSAERFRGENETIDPVAGHIPGAISLPFTDNLTGDPPVMRSAGDLRSRFESAGIRDASRVICYCGSGVTACHNLLAFELAGLRGARLYPGSWSEWIQHHDV
ncbi:sulfurtransferase [candidate division KSB1 bacterium]|nr:sulfurtransferase [candidate division KSB1 bacterium]